MVLLGEIIEAEELKASGFLLDIVGQDALEARIDALCQRAVENAPLTTRAFKEVLRRMTLETLPEADDLMAEVYGSDDFRLGVQTFLSRTKALPGWSGR